MSITLQTLIDETADYTKVTLEGTGTPVVYDADSQAFIDRFTSAINEAKNIVAKKIRLTTSEDVELDEDACFDVDDLTDTFWRLVTVKYDDSYVYTQEQTGVIWCNAPAYGTVTVEYEYVPADLDDLTDTYPFADSVSWRLLCYYAAATYYLIKGTTTSMTKYGAWKNKWEDGLNSLGGGGKMARRKVKATYNLGEYYERI